MKKQKAAKKLKKEEMREKEKEKESLKDSASGSSNQNIDNKRKLVSEPGSSSASKKPKLEGTLANYIPGSA